MGFGHADLILAVPACWSDCDSLDDFATIAHAIFGPSTASRLRIATKYHRLNCAHLSGAEVADYQLVDSQGATGARWRTRPPEGDRRYHLIGRDAARQPPEGDREEPILRSQATLSRSVGGDAGAVRDLAAQLGL